MRRRLLCGLLVRSQPSHVQEGCSSAKFFNLYLSSIRRASEPGSKAAQRTADEGVFTVSIPSYTPSGC